jgi:hypothetical protein
MSGGIVGYQPQKHYMDREDQEAFFSFPASVEKILTNIFSSFYSTYHFLQVHQYAV